MGAEMHGIVRRTAERYGLNPTDEQEIRRTAFRHAFARELRRLGFDGTPETLNAISDARAFAQGYAGIDLDVRVLVECDYDRHCAAGNETG